MLLVQQSKRLVHDEEDES